MSAYFAEFLGTLILILFGNGVVANVLLKKTKGNNSGWIVISWGWGIGVAIAVYAVGRISGAHINPAVTVSLASIGHFGWDQVTGYIIAQLLGAFAGSILVWLVYLAHYQEDNDPEMIRATFCTSPAVRKPGLNFLTEFIATAVLVFGILAIAANASPDKHEGPIDLQIVFSSWINPLLVGLLVFAVGLSLGGPTGYAVNPARDLATRIAHALLPIRGKGHSDWAYSWIPVVAPFLGGLTGALIFYYCGMTS